MSVSPSRCAAERQVEIRPGGFQPWGAALLLDSLLHLVLPTRWERLGEIGLIQAVK